MISFFISIQKIFSYPAPAQFLRTPQSTIFCFDNLCDPYQENPGRFDRGSLDNSFFIFLKIHHNVVTATSLFDQSVYAYFINDTAQPPVNEVFIMKYSVNEACIGCGLCADTCPEIFFMNDEGKAEAVDEDVREDLLDSAAEAQDNCPAEAIAEA